MLQKTIILVLLINLAGCAYKGRNLEEYVDYPETILKDPHFVNYREKKDSLERMYLRKEISYEQYLRQKNELDTKYSREVEERESKIRF